jgi:hypothetical protein
MDSNEKNIIVESFQKGLNTGIAELILLSVVSHAKQPMYGYQIAKVIEKENQEIPVLNWELSIRFSVLWRSPFLGKPCRSVNIRSAPSILSDHGAGVRSAGTIN